MTSKFMRRNLLKSSERPGKGQGTEVIEAKRKEVSGGGPRTKQQRFGKVRLIISVECGNGEAPAVFMKFILIWINRRGRWIPCSLPLVRTAAP